MLSERLHDHNSSRGSSNCLQKVSVMSAASRIAFGPRALPYSFEEIMKKSLWLIAISTALASSLHAEEKLSDYFPPPESKGGWRSALSENGDPHKEIFAKLGVDAAKLKEAWD